LLDLAIARQDRGGIMPIGSVISASKTLNPTFLSSRAAMTLKRLILSGLTLLVTFLIGLSLSDSLNQPQVQNQLELYQTNLVLQASAWQGHNEAETDNFEQAGQAILGNQPLQDAIQKYEQARQSLQKQVEQDLKQEIAAESNPDSGQSNQPAAVRRQNSLAQTELQLGLLYAQTDQTDQALSTWARIQERGRGVVSEPLLNTSNLLQTLWGLSPQLPAQAKVNPEAELTSTLKGWFRIQALQRLYQVTGASESEVALAQIQQQAAEQAWGRLILVAVMPALGGLVGAGILVIGLVRGGLERYRRLSPDSPPVKPPVDPPDKPSPEKELLGAAMTEIPWGTETIWQVMVLWFTAFFGVSLFIVPLMAQLLGVTPGNVNALTQAIFALVSYSLLMATGLTILYLCLKPFLAHPVSWLRLQLAGGWFGWGVGGYLAALPLVVGVSWLNQQLLQDQGGSNPILEIIIGSQDRLTIGILFLMVAGLAPLFEETLFRGFFLTSLTRYLPAWGAIALSSVLFAVAHLNVADILPLTVLGMVLGSVYLRSGNLLASMLMHSLWNSGSFLGLLSLSGGSQ
jgi:uncharacterized protein